MKRDEKEAVITAIAADINEAEAIFVVDYRGITVAQIASLRTQLREADTTLRVTKNTLTIRATDACEAPGAEELKSVLVGPTAIAFVRGDVALAAKALAAAQKETSVLAFKGGLMAGKTLSADEITALSKLPSRDVLIGQLVGLAASPLSGLVRSLAGLVGGLASQLGQIHDQGLVPAAGSAAPAAAEEAPAPEAEAEAPAEEAPAAESEAPTEESAPEVEAEAPAVEAAVEEAPEAEAAEDAAEETAEQSDGDEPAAEAASDETAPADGAAEDGDVSADKNDDENSDA